MTTKKYDLAVKTGTYTSNGQEKGRYENIGMVMEKDDGGTFILMKRTFNPAGVPNPDNKDMITVSMFEPSEKGATGGDSQKPRQAKPASSVLEDDLPF